ncbi:tyrosine-type recombinase/integrase [Dysosmobacter welbionis]|uniref:tyrosine-type recombinase/integrase n=1 Tax=Dysosmobacter welbionis TaxID=2093857 RepID=UPI003AB2751D
MREAMETAQQDRTAAPAELTVTWEEVCRYLDSLAARGRRRETIQVYRPKLEAFYHFLPEDKRVAADTLELWRAALLREGYSPGTANTHVSAANGLLAYLGRRDLQLIGQLDTEEEIQPELSRTEYLRLLATARNLGRERTYLMVKVFALTGIRVSELNRVTVRAVEEGRVLTACDGRAQYVLIPACLRKELAVYLRRVGITAGPVFVTRSGRPMRRTQVSGEIRTLCRDARVDGDKSNPRCLRRLYQVTQERIRDSVQILAEQAHKRMLEEEQLTVGWEQGS